MSDEELPEPELLEEELLDDDEDSDDSGFPELTTIVIVEPLSMVLPALGL